ncbi:excalibur calcium-binding domain-containing protein [Cryobacterium sp. SO2]|uniref:excalibur calcium-binding domain-containing protein n=1 Tax=Cryobacterium sp. SO2 TaxID=1897060 RepID=UPI00223DCF2A|nr:excalibur calcium-binding domain-containing protein [Cryobacterium sp. SO2]WEO76783.1 excalibur calcium-binding domain-containing protein [Cryobacterium sp. SO2]
MRNTHTNLPTSGRLMVFSVGVVLCLGLSAGAAPAIAATQTGTSTVTKVAVTVFKNCTALNAKYPGGVAKTGVTGNLVNGKKRPFTKKPVFSTPLYAANKKSDRDKDGIACER